MSKQVYQKYISTVMELAKKEKSGENALILRPVDYPKLSQV